MKKTELLKPDIILYIKRLYRINQDINIVISKIEITQLVGYKFQIDFEYTNKNNDFKKNDQLCLDLETIFFFSKPIAWINKTIEQKTIEYKKNLNNE